MAGRLESVTVFHIADTDVCFAAKLAIRLSPVPGAFRPEAARLSEHPKSEAAIPKRGADGFKGSGRKTVNCDGLLSVAHEADIKDPQSASRRNTACHVGCPRSRSFLS